MKIRRRSSRIWLVFYIFAIPLVLYWASQQYREIINKIETFVYDPWLSVSGTPFSLGVGHQDPGYLMPRTLREKGYSYCSPQAGNEICPIWRGLLGAKFKLLIPLKATGQVEANTYRALYSDDTFVKKEPVYVIPVLDGSSQEINDAPYWVRREDRPWRERNEAIRHLVEGAKSQARNRIIRALSLLAFQVVSLLALPYVALTLITRAIHWVGNGEP